MTEKHARQTPKKKIRIDYGKAARALALLILVLTIVFSYMPAAFGKGIMNYDRDLIRPSGELGSKAPGIRAETAIMYSLDLDMPVYEKNADKKMPPYSMTKILTGYLALENLDPDTVLTASENATRELKDGMELELDPGEKAKVIDLVYALMMMSANDGAIVLAEGVSGTEKAFVDLMNETVQKWGCENTHFVNTNGWENKNHYTTARDLSIIFSAALEYDLFLTLISTKYYSLPYVVTEVIEPESEESAPARNRRNKNADGRKPGCFPWPAEGPSPRILRSSPSRRVSVPFPAHSHRLSVPSLS